MILLSRREICREISVGSFNPEKIEPTPISLDTDFLGSDTDFLGFD